MKRREFLSGSVATLAVAATPAFGNKKSLLVAEVPEAAARARGSLPDSGGVLLIAYIQGPLSQVVAFMERVYAVMWGDDWRENKNISDSYKFWRDVLGDAPEVRQPFVLNDEMWRETFFSTCREMCYRIKYTRQLA